MPLVGHGSESANNPQAAGPGCGACGGTWGVFEGNGGDLRIGLPLQSVHDGHVLRHTPLRLSVFVEAPREAIERVLAEHEIVHSLVVNGWLHLLRIDPETDAIERRHDGRWLTASGAAA